MSLLGDIGKELAEDMAEVGILMGIFIAGLIVMTFGFFWAGFAIMLYAFYRFLPDEGRVVDHAKERGEKEKTSGAKKIAKRIFNRDGTTKAMEYLDRAGFSRKESERIVNKWIEEEEKETKEELEEVAKEMVG